MKSNIIYGHRPGLIPRLLRWLGHKTWFRLYWLGCKVIELNVDIDDFDLVGWYPAVRIYTVRPVAADAEYIDAILQIAKEGFDGIERITRTAPNGALIAYTNMRPWIETEAALAGAVLDRLSHAKPTT